MEGGWTATNGSHHFIDNRWVASATGQTIDVVDPRTARRSHASRAAPPRTSTQP